MPLESKVESILFYKNEPVELKSLCLYLEKNEDEIKKVIEKLKENLIDRGITLVEESDTYMLATNSEAAEIIDKIAREELSKDLGKAGLETLSIILYKGAATRREVDYVRGVNSTFILRSLIARGLVERAEKSGRVFIYKPTIALLAHLGLNKLEDLPEFRNVRMEIERAAETENQTENV